LPFESNGAKIESLNRLISFPISPEFPILERCIVEHWQHLFVLSFKRDLIELLTFDVQVEHVTGRFALPIGCYARVIADRLTFDAA